MHHSPIKQSASGNSPAAASHAGEAASGTLPQPQATLNKASKVNLSCIYLLIIQVATDILGWNHLGYCQEPLIQTATTQQ